MHRLLQFVLFSDLVFAGFGCLSVELFGGEFEVEQRFLETAHGGWVVLPEWGARQMDTVVERVLLHAVLEERRETDVV